ncbi:hypothetical protein CUMW_261300, partial [Citrus unshiu]
MLMETFTKKKPTDVVAELSLKCWINDFGEERHFAVKKQCVLSILSLALECTMESPEERIDAKDIVTRLLEIRDKLTKSLANLN